MLPQRNTLFTSLSFRDHFTHLYANALVVVISKHLITFRHPVVHHTIPVTNLETVFQVSSPFPFSMLFLTKNILLSSTLNGGSGVFQGIVAAIVAICIVYICYYPLHVFSVSHCTACSPAWQILYHVTNSKQIAHSY